jgi:hypothetical protein
MGDHKRLKPQKVKSPTKWSHLNSSKPVTKMSKQWYCNGWSQKVETPNTGVHGHCDCDSTVVAFIHLNITLWWQHGTYFLQVPALTQLFPVCLQEGSHQMSQELGWLYDLQLPAVVVVPYSAFLCEKSLLVVPETYQNNWAYQSQRCAAFWKLSDLRLIFNIRNRLTVLCVWKLFSTWDSLCHKN